MALTIQDQAQSNIFAAREHTPVKNHTRHNITAQVEQNSDNTRDMKNVGTQEGWLFWGAKNSRENKKNIRGNDNPNQVLAGQFGNFQGVAEGNRIPGNARQDPGVIIANPGSRGPNRGINRDFSLVGAGQDQNTFFAQDPNIRVTRGITVTHRKRIDIATAKRRLEIAIGKRPREINKRAFMEKL